MTKRFMTLAATAAMVLAFSPQMFAQVDEQLTITVGTVVATVQLSTGGVLSVTCTGAGASAATCGDFWPATETPVGTHLIVGGATGATIADGGQDGTINISGDAAFDGFNIDDTAKGGVSSLPLPTLQNQNETDATSSGAGTLTVNFTDIDYTNLSPLIGVADSNTTSVRPTNVTPGCGSANGAT